MGVMFSPVSGMIILWIANFWNCKPLRPGVRLPGEFVIE